MTARLSVVYDRAGCVDGPRPCRKLSCRSHLDHDGKRGPDAAKGYTCALDFVDRHPDGATHVEIGAEIGVCRERVRQIEKRALDKLRSRCSPDEFDAIFTARIDPPRHEGL